MDADTIFILVMPVVFFHVFLGICFASNLFEDSYKTDKWINKIILTILTMFFIPEVLFVGLILVVMMFLIVCNDTLKK